MEAPYDRIERKRICVITDKIDVNRMGDQREVKCIEHPVDSRNITLEITSSIMQLLTTTKRP